MWSTDLLSAGLRTDIMIVLHPMNNSDVLASITERDYEDEFGTGTKVPPHLVYMTAFGVHASSRMHIKTPHNAKSYDLCCVSDHA